MNNSEKSETEKVVVRYSSTFVGVQGRLMLLLHGLIRGRSDSDKNVHRTFALNHSRACDFVGASAVFRAFAGQRPFTYTRNVGGLFRPNQTLAESNTG
ncbi:hypothetical protein CKO51_11245 [Rhodopirellula sp. SM50]|nr:hypothetical protein CKO51_11245 [Rhodopirellula sp. SM50]